jgi:hypothetical protein
VIVLVIVVVAVLVVLAVSGPRPVPPPSPWCGACLLWAVALARLVAAPPARRTARRPRLTWRLRLRLTYVTEPFAAA